jgi:hypothetical protein
MRTAKVVLLLYDDSKVPYGMKQGYGIFVTNQAYIKGSFPIRYFNVLSPN